MLGAGEGLRQGRRSVSGESQHLGLWLGVRQFYPKLHAAEAALAPEAHPESRSAGLSRPGLDASPPPPNTARAEQREGAVGGWGRPWTEGPFGVCPGRPPRLVLAPRPSGFSVLVGETEACSLPSGTGLGVRLGALTPAGWTLHAARAKGMSGAAAQPPARGRDWALSDPVARPAGPPPLPAWDGRPDSGRPLGEAPPRRHLWANRAPGGAGGLSPYCF